MAVENRGAVMVPRAYRSCVVPRGQDLYCLCLMASASRRWCVRIDAGGESMAKH